eukprot:scaffold1513_cov100-Amphora_coffeaeformis.AAC.18
MVRVVAMNGSRALGMYAVPVGSPSIPFYPMGRTVTWMTFVRDLLKVKRVPRMPYVKNQVCAYESWTVDAPKVCCPGGQPAAYVQNPGNTYNGEYCTNQPSGSPCNDNRLCTSGLCQGGTCR